jgi:hypothetical protein
MTLHYTNEYNTQLKKDLKKLTDAEFVEKYEYPKSDFNGADL